MSLGEFNELVINLKDRDNNKIIWKIVTFHFLMLIKNETMFSFCVEFITVNNRVRTFYTFVLSKSKNEQYERCEYDDSFSMLMSAVLDW